MIHPLPPPKHSQKHYRAADKAAQLCGLVLAGGDGQRLKNFVRRLRGDALPKQYVNFSGSGSMLEHTYRRAEKIIPRQRLFTVINRAHADFPEVHEQLRDRDPATLVVQPVNRETAHGLLLPLTYLQKRWPGAVVAVFPSDQFILEADRLMRHVRLAHAVVEQRPSSLVLLGVGPDYGESDYGYIVPSAACDTTGWGIHSVQTFVEKPDAVRAHDLIRQGALWNTMLMVFSAAALFQWVNEIVPDVFRRFARIYDAIGTAAEAATIREAYAEMQPMNFSKDLLEPIAHRHPGKLTVLPVTDVTWSDWGCESRIVRSLKSIGKVPCEQQPAAMVQRQRRSRAKRGDSDRPSSFTLQ